MTNNQAQEVTEGKPAKEKPEKKKRGIVGRIFKWIGLGVLCLLLIAGLLFQAPWKVTAVLVVILLACTALPRPLRKWFWLLVGVIILALIIWVFLPDDSEGWRPYTFDEELAALEAKYAIPDEENAAEIYDQLLEDYGANSFYPDFWDPEIHYLIMKEPWSSKDHPELADWLRSKDKVIAKLLEASQLEKCHFPIAADTVAFGHSAERSACLRNWAQLLTSAGNNDMGDERVSEALKKHAAVLQMGDHLCQQPLTLYQLSGIAVGGLALEKLSRFVAEGKPGRADLRFIAGSIRRLESNWMHDFSGILESDKLMTKNTLSTMIYETDRQGKIRLSRDPLAQFRARYPQQIGPQSYWHRRIMKAAVLPMWFVATPGPKELGAMVDRAYKQSYAMAEPTFDWGKEQPESRLGFPFGFSHRLNFPAWIEKYLKWSGQTYYGFHNIYMKQLASHRGLRLLVAIREYEIEHGTWPATLDAIKSRVPAEAYTDPITGEDFIYDNHGERFSLYCEAANIWPK